MKPIYSLFIILILLNATQASIVGKIFDMIFPFENPIPHYEPTPVTPSLQKWLSTYALSHPNIGPRSDQDMDKTLSWFDKTFGDAYPLHRAAMTGDQNTIKSLLIDQKLNPNQKMPVWFDSEPLGWAASFGQLHTIIDLIKLGADPIRPVNKAKNSPLSDAVREKQDHVITFFQEFNKQLRREVSESELEWLNNYELNHSNGGPRWNQFIVEKDWKNDWPVQWYAMKGDNEKLRYLCEEKNMDPNGQMITWFNSEPLGWAASFGQLHSVIELIKLGANPFRAPNAAGFVPETDAERENHSHVVQFFEDYKNFLKQQQADKFLP